MNEKNGMENAMKSNRLEQIEWILNIQKDASVAELASMLKVSEMTVRRDLIELEKRGIVTRYHGGAIISSAEIKTMLPAYHPEECMEEKRQIGSAACNYLREMISGGEVNSVVMLAGSTMIEMVKAVDYTIPITVVTGNLSIANILSQNVNNSVILLGGKVYPPTMSVSGFLAEQTLTYLSVDCTFMGISAIDKDGWMYCYDDMDASFLQRLLKVSRHNIILADHTKFGTTCPMRVCRLDGDFEIITDKNVSQEFLAAYTALGVKITQV